MSATSRPLRASSRCSARYLTGQIVGQLFGQAAGGVLGDLFGWRNVFFVLAGIFALATVGAGVRTLDQSAHPRRRRARPGRRASSPTMPRCFASPWARFVIFAVFIESSVAWGAFAYVGADLHLRFGLSFTAIGLIVGTFGIGGLIYAGSVQQL